MGKKALKRYVVGKREVWISFNYIDAKSREDAIDKVRLGQAYDVDGLEYSHTLDTDTWTVEEI